MSTLLELVDAMKLHDYLEQAKKKESILLPSLSRDRRTRIREQREEVCYEAEIPGGEEEPEEGN